MTRAAPPRRGLLFFAALDDEALDRVALPPPPRRDAPPRDAEPRFVALFFAELRLAVLFEVLLDVLFVALFDDRFEAPFAVLRFAPPRLAALFLAPPRLAALFRAPERLLIAGPRRVLFFPALRFMPRPDFFIAIAASPPPGVIVGAARIVRRVAQVPGAPM